MNPAPPNPASGDHRPASLMMRRLAVLPVAYSGLRKRAHYTNRFGALMSDFRWRSRDIDNDLMCAISADSPDLKHISELIKAGADVNSLNPKETNTVLSESLFMMLYGLKIEVIDLLLDCGANPHPILSNGNCALRSACWTHKPEVVRRILQYGVNPNFVLDHDESLLDWVDYDQHVLEQFDRADDAIRMKDIYNQLKNAGALHLEEMTTERPVYWLDVAGWRRFGLLSLYGNLKPEAILPRDIVSDFCEWHRSNPDPWPNSHINAEIVYDLQAFYETGIRLTSHIRKHIPPDIELVFTYVAPEVGPRTARKIRIDCE